MYLNFILKIYTFTKCVLKKLNSIDKILFIKEIMLYLIVSETRQIIFDKPVHSLERKLGIHNNN